jgi:hypothetical protein
MSIIERCLLALVIVMALGMAALYVQKNHYEQQAISEQATIDKLDAVNTEFKAQVDKQNAYVNKLSDDTAKRLTAATAAVAAANNTAKTHENRAQELESATAKGNDCQAANTLFHGYLRSIRK